MFDVPVSRRTQADRSASTQSAVLDATVECLAKFGYAGTNTREIAARAGISRGALTHHYPNRSDVIVAAIERLFDRLAQRFVEEFTARADDARTLEGAVDTLWNILGDNNYAAVLEVIVASRTDSELRVVVHGVAARLESSVVAVFNAVTPVPLDEPAARLVISAAFAIVQGAFVSQYAGYGDPDQVIGVARMLARLIDLETGQLLLASADQNTDQITNRSVDDIDG